MVSHFRDESKDKHEDKQQDSELQQGNKIDGEQKEDIRNENHSKKVFGVNCLVIKMTIKVYQEFINP